RWRRSEGWKRFWEAIGAGFRRNWCGPYARFRRWSVSARWKHGVSLPTWPRERPKRFKLMRRGRRFYDLSRRRDERLPRVNASIETGRIRLRQLSYALGSAARRLLSSEGASQSA